MKGEEGKGESNTTRNKGEKGGASKRGRKTKLVPD